MPQKLMVAALVGGAWALTAGFSAAPRASADTCSLLSQAQVTAALGVPIAAGQALAEGLCTWRESGKQTGKKVALTMLTVERFNIGKTPLAGAEKPPVSGVGDEAYYKYFSAPRYEKIKVVDLNVRKGNATFGVEVWGFSIDDAKSKAKTLALEVAAKM